MVEKLKKREYWSMRSGQVLVPLRLTQLVISCCCCRLLATANLSKEHFTAHNFTMWTTLLLTRLLASIHTVFYLLVFGNVSSIDSIFWFSWASSFKTRQVYFVLRNNSLQTVTWCFQNLELKLRIFVPTRWTLFICILVPISMFNTSKL